MVVFGLIGGIASGKSLVADQFASLGAEILDGDRAGHEILRQEEVRATLVSRWGTGILDGSGEISRPAIAKIVFGPDEKNKVELEYLEQIAHPRIERLLGDRLQRLANSSSAPAAILDAPLLLKAGWDRYCTALIFVDTPRPLRLARALARGWTAESFAAREAAQGSLDERRRRADFVIDNRGTVDETRRQVEIIWREAVEPV